MKVKKIVHSLFLLGLILLIQTLSLEADISTKADFSNKADLSKLDWPLEELPRMSRAIARSAISDPRRHRIFVDSSA